LQLVREFSAFHGSRRLLSALTSVRYLSLSWASPIQSIYPLPTSWKSILILSTNLLLRLPSGLLTGFPTMILYTTLCSSISTTRPAHLIVLTYSLTAWCTVLLEKLTGLQLVKKFPAFHGTRRFITALISFCYLSLSWASPIHSIYPHPTSWRSILILSTHLLLRLPSGLLLFGLPHENPIHQPLLNHTRHTSSPSHCTYLLAYLLHGAESFLRS